MFMKPVMHRATMKMRGTKILVVVDVAIIIEIIFTAII